MKAFTMLLWLVCVPAMLLGSDGDRIIVGPFSTMAPGDTPSGWSPMTFPKIETHTRYELVKEEGRTVLSATSRSSASGLIKEMDVCPAEYPVLTWAWKISNTIANGDVTRKSGDDYAARIYVTFSDDGRHSTWFQRAQAAAIKMVYGKAPPFAALAYVWANRADVASIHPNAYTDRCRMIAVESGPEHLGRWRTARRDIVDDFRRAFGHGPTRISGIAVMTDTDNTEESASAWFGDIALHRQ